MFNQTSRKRSLAAIVTALALASPVCALSLAQPAWADTRSDFEKGCKDSGGTFTENAENIMCSATGRTTITCNKAATSCTAGKQSGTVRPVRPTTGTFHGYTAVAKSKPHTIHQPTISRVHRRSKS
jgi:hypothetical protein